MNAKKRRFIETTLPMVIGYGLTLAAVTELFGFGFGLVAILIFSVVDILMVHRHEIHPSYIVWKGEEFETLTQLIKHIESKPK